MNILQKINEDKDYYSFEYYGLNDMATGIEARTLIDKAEEIKDYFHDKELKLNDIDSFIDFMFVKKFIQFKELSPYIQQEFKETFDEMISFIEQIDSKYQVKDVIKYVNNNINEIITGSKYHFDKEVFEIAFKYHSGCKKAILYLMDNKYYLIVDNFFDINHIINENEDFKQAMLSTNHLDDIKSYRLEEYLKIIEWYKCNQKVDDELLNPIFDKVIEYGNSIYDIVTEDNAIQYDRTINIIFRFLSSINHKEANNFEVKIKKLKVTMDNYVQKHGRQFSFEIPLDTLLQPFRDDKNSLRTKILMLTHTKKENGKGLESFYTRNGRYKGDPLTEIFATSTPHDSYFTMMKQGVLNISDHIHLNVLNYFICEERIVDFMTMLDTIVKEICDYYKIDFEELEFDTDFKILLNYYIDLINAEKVKNEYLSKGLNFCIISFQCCLIEKLLRSLYKNQTQDTYIKLDWYSLGNLLNPKDKTMLKFFNEDELKVFRYYLVDGSNGKVGYNYRNNFAHYKNIKTKDIQFEISLKTLRLLITMINDIDLTIIG